MVVNRSYESFLEHGLHFSHWKESLSPYMQTLDTQAYAVRDSNSVSLLATQRNALCGLTGDRSRTLLTGIITSITSTVLATSVIQTPCPIVKAFQ